MKDQSDKMSNAYISQIEWLNKVYAWRIIQFLNNDKEVYSPKRVNDTIKCVDRSQRGVIRIKTSKKNRTTNTSQLNEVISDRIDFM